MSQPSTPRGVTRRDTIGNYFDPKLGVQKPSPEPPKPPKPAPLKASLLDLARRSKEPSQTSVFDGTAGDRQKPNRPSSSLENFKYTTYRLDSPDLAHRISQNASVDLTHGDISYLAQLHRNTLYKGDNFVIDSPERTRKKFKDFTGLSGQRVRPSLYESFTDSIYATDESFSPGESQIFAQNRNSIRASMELGQSRSGGSSRASVTSPPTLIILKKPSKQQKVRKKHDNNREKMHNKETQNSIREIKNNRDRRHSERRKYSLESKQFEKPRRKSISHKSERHSGQVISIEMNDSVSPTRNSTESIRYYRKHSKSKRDKTKRHGKRLSLIDMHKRETDMKLASGVAISNGDEQSSAFANIKSLSPTPNFVIAKRKKSSVRFSVVEDAIEKKDDKSSEDADAQEEESRTGQILGPLKEEEEPMEDTDDGRGDIEDDRRDIEELRKQLEKSNIAKQSRSSSDPIDTDVSSSRSTSSASSRSSSGSRSSSSNSRSSSSGSSRSSSGSRSSYTSYSGSSYSSSSDSSSRSSSSSGQSSRSRSRSRSKRVVKEEEKAESINGEILDGDKHLKIEDEQKKKSVICLLM